MFTKTIEKRGLQAVEKVPTACIFAVPGVAYNYFGGKIHYSLGNRNLAASINS